MNERSSERMRWISALIVAGMFPWQMAAGGGERETYGRPPASKATATEMLRAAIEDLTATFGKRYPRGREYLQRLDAIHRNASSGRAQDVKRRRRFRDPPREALIANPLVSAHPLLFIVRKQYRPDHHNTATMFQTGEINTASFEGAGP